ncbi:bifunctional dihydrofolate synthase / folylpolyglutamate synthase [Synechococcus sp. SYN20]|uniref:bifunctional folylpolyglutamate synthase/dihydrofolate synthase n=1 Tax=Synechococcus sp. SYN20 TaxID=1050714 RepID=UPI001862886F|nr:cyanophycin synthetase [Synechococcus sp. SYN20]QNJ25223.1 bifunctional dihydrofolate synthase / folylpolyglutamate synthase [Synechococcus sp. SYN20]
MTRSKLDPLDELADLLSPFEQRGMDLSLERMQAALAALANPCAGVPAVQVVGTNGKGSIACMIHSGLTAAGLRSGLTTSPHLTSWCERICVNQQQIELAQLRQLLRQLQPVARHHNLTPFEQLITAAMIHFEANALDWLVLEAGLGGRLDATTAHPNRPLIAIGSIGMDHCEHLGNSLTAISSEKAAVIGPGAHVISAPQHDAVTKVLEARCQDMGATLEWVKPLTNEWELGLSGHLQRRNGAVARAALRRMNAFGSAITEEQIRRGLAQARWPGRLQTLHWNHHSVRVDGAHNPDAAEQLALERRDWSESGHQQIWILGIQGHKQAPEMLRILLEPNDEAWIVPVPGHVSWTTDQLSEICPTHAHQLRSASCVEDVLVNLFKNDSGKPKLIPVIAGSLYLIGSLLAEKVLKEP